MERNPETLATRASRTHSVEWLGEEGIRSALVDVIRGIVRRRRSNEGERQHAEAVGPRETAGQKTCCAATCCA